MYVHSMVEGNSGSHSLLLSLFLLLTNRPVSVLFVFTVSGGEKRSFKITVTVTFPDESKNVGVKEFLHADEKYITRYSETFVTDI